MLFSKSSSFLLEISSHVNLTLYLTLGLPKWLSGKESACNAGGTRNMGLIPGSGRSYGKGNGNLLEYSCLENPMVGGAWWAIVHGVAKSRTRLSD